MRSFTICSSPFHAARWRGQQPLLSAMLVRASFLSSTSTTSLQTNKEIGQKKPTIKTTLINTQSLSKQSINRFSFPVVQWSARPDCIKFQSINRRIPEFQTVIANLPVSIKGCVVKRGVSSAVHAIHIGASPDTEKQKGLSVFHNRQYTTGIPYPTPNKHCPSLCKVYPRV